MAERRYKHPQVNLRLPEELKNRISALAEKNKRSANAEMVAAIESWVEFAEKNSNSKLVNWGEEFLPESPADTVTMSEKQLSRIVNVAVDETTKALLEKFEFLPKENKKP